MSLRDSTVTLSGLELVRLLRQFVDTRCDELGIQGHENWPSVVAAREDDEQEFFRRLEELRLRGGLKSLVAAKEFVRPLLGQED